MRRAATPRLTIGMCTYDDFDGVYFTVQALRWYHQEVMDQTEILVIDNHPGSDHSKRLTEFMSKVKNGLLIRYDAKKSTSVRNEVFHHAKGEFVLCLDCHVLLELGSVARLLAYYDAHPDTQDLLQGPLQYDELEERTIATHWVPRWQQDMYGVWERESRGVDRDAEPFEIPMCGLGLFSCRKDAWLKFPALFKGFGGEEGYIHEKYRKAGFRCLCLPFLRWLHRFGHLGTAPYRPTLEDRVYNYFVGWLELGLDINEITNFYSATMAKGKLLRLLEKARTDLSVQLQSQADSPSASGETPATLLQQAKQMATMLLGLPPDHRDNLLQLLRTTNETSYALLLYELDKLRSVNQAQLKIVS